jgi:hypothetical protein
MSYVVNPDGTSRQVTNLGWLLTHSDEVEKFEVIGNMRFIRLGKIRWEYPDKSFYETGDSILIAHLKDGRFYIVQWLSYKVMLDWLHRPKFIGLPIVWFGWAMKIGQTLEDTLKN